MRVNVALHQKTRQELWGSPHFQGQVHSLPRAEDNQDIRGNPLLPSLTTRLTSSAKLPAVKTLGDLQDIDLLMEKGEGKACR